MNPYPTLWHDNKFSEINYVLERVTQIRQYCSCLDGDDYIEEVRTIVKATSSILAKIAAKAAEIDETGQPSRSQKDAEIYRNSHPG